MGARLSFATFAHFHVSLSIRCHSPSLFFV